MKYVQEKTNIIYCTFKIIYFAVGEKIFGVYLVKKNYFNYIFTYIITSYNLRYF